MKPDILFRFNKDNTMISATDLRKTTEKNKDREINRIVNLELMQIEKNVKKSAEMGENSIRYTDFHSINEKKIKQCTRT